MFDKALSPFKFICAMWIICQLTIISFWLEKFTYKKQHGYKLYVGGRSILVDKATSIWYRTKHFQYFIRFIPFLAMIGWSWTFGVGCDLSFIFLYSTLRDAWLFGCRQ